jgi:RHS repeat-associated protein
LNRLASAAATNGAWGQSYTYDGFGNLTDKEPTGSAPPLHVTVDPATNRWTGIPCDANGNWPASYDVENHLLAWPGYQYYAYDYRGKRLTKQPAGGSVELYVYGIEGRKLATYQCGGTQVSPTACGNPVYDTYWKGKLVKSKGNLVATDRLGSVRWSAVDGNQSYYPYGEERTSTSDNRDKFGTYMRDNPGQDYADQRYYYPGTGRFYTADPAGILAVDSSTPSTWNSYHYPRDPVNQIDPSVDW